MVSDVNYCSGLFCVFFGWMDFVIVCDVWWDGWGLVGYWMFILLMFVFVGWF